MANKSNRVCEICIFSKWHQGKSALASGCVCYLNPFKPVAMGLFGKCCQRKANKMAQYPKYKK